MADAVLGAGEDGFLGGNGKDLLELALADVDVGVGQVDLMMTGMSLRPCLLARWTLATVCASTPWAASMMRARLRRRKGCARLRRRNRHGRECR